MCVHTIDDARAPVCLFLSAWACLQLVLSRLLQNEKTDSASTAASAAAVAASPKGSPSKSRTKSPERERSSHRRSRSPSVKSGKKKAN